MYRPPGRKKKTSKRFRSPRICIDSLPTNCTFLTTNMSRSNLSCQSCMCCEEEEELPCCGSQKCPKKETKQTQTQSCTAAQTKPPKCCPPPIDPSCPICMAEAEKNNSCPTCKKPLQPKKEEPRCPTCSQPVEPPCNECKKNKEDDGCPVCKSQQPPKKSQSGQSCPVAIQIPSGQGGSSKLNIVMTIKESDAGDNEEPCCPESESESEAEPCCQPKKAEPKKGPCCAHDKPKKPSPCCAPQPCCALESCKSNPIHSMPKQKTSKTGLGKTDKNEKTGKNEKSGKTPAKHEKSGKNDNQVMCSEECKAMREGGCCCVYPPAYKQYSCVGKISGFCDCEKPEETGDQEE